MTKLCVLCFSTCVLAVTAGAQVNLSQWQFVRTDMANVWEVERPVKEGKPESVPLWQDVTLPHCYNAEDGVDPDVNTRPGGQDGFPVPNYDWNSYPRARTFTFGLNVAF